MSTKGTTSEAAACFLAAAQGAYFVIGGLWPVVHMPSFEFITGRKTDKWLVKSVGLLLAAIGVAQLVAARRGRIETEMRALSLGSAGVLAAVDVVYWRRGVLRPVYLLDALAETALAIGWLLSGRPPRGARESRAERAAASADPRRRPGRARC